MDLKALFKFDILKVIFFMLCSPLCWYYILFKHKCQEIGIIFISNDKKECKVKKKRIKIVLKNPKKSAK